MAWLHGRPKSHAKDEKPQPRSQIFGDDDYRLILPSVKGVEYLVNHWQKCGMYEHGMSGSSPLSWQELEAYSNQTQSNLDCWESEQIINMSKSYVSFSRNADELDCLAPFSPELTEEQIQEIKKKTATQAKNILRRPAS